MPFAIGFTPPVQAPAIDEQDGLGKAREPVKSLVQVHFPQRNTTLAYYNDAFDLQQGDYVFVDGKLAGLRGRVTGVSLSFKIKPADYKRVIGVADTAVTGRFCQAGSHFVTFDPAALPYAKARSWFMAPEPEDAYITGAGGNSFFLDNLAAMGADDGVAERGHDYYVQCRVVYISVEGARGRAIVEGSRPYEVEFTLINGEVSDLVCGCISAYPCKHEFAAMLQLRETTRLIETFYASAHEKTGYFAAVAKPTFFTFAVDGPGAAESLTLK